MQIRKAVILGGQGAVGGLLAGLLQPTGCQVTLVDRRPGPSALVQDLDAPWESSLVAALAEADLVVAALPEAIALRLAPAILRGMHTDALWVDTLSVKGEICQLLATEAAPAERLSLNPMFAPALGWAGHAVACVEVAAGPRAQELRQLVIAAGARVESISAAAHDQITAATQVATHAALLAFGLAMQTSGYDAATAWRLATPPHRILAALLARIANGNPEVYWDIQRHHPAAQEMRASLVSALEMLQAQTREDRSQEFAAVMQALQTLLSPQQKELAELGDRLVRASH